MKVGCNRMLKDAHKYCNVALTVEFHTCELNFSVKQKNNCKVGPTAVS